MRNSRYDWGVAAYFPQGWYRHGARVTWKTSLLRWFRYRSPVSCSCSQSCQFGLFDTETVKVCLESGDVEARPYMSVLVRMSSKAEDLEINGCREPEHAWNRTSISSIRLIARHHVIVVKRWWERLLHARIIVGHQTKVELGGIWILPLVMSLGHPPPCWRRLILSSWAQSWTAFSDNIWFLWFNGSWAFARQW